MFYFYLLLVLFIQFRVKGQLEDDMEEKIVTILPDDIEVAVREGQDLVLTCKIQGPTVTNCSWEMNGVSRMMSTTIENRQYHTKHYGKCRIALKVTLQDIGQWTCNMFTEDDPVRPKSATTQVSLVQKKPTSIVGLVTIIIIGLLLLVIYVITFGLLKTCRFDQNNGKSFKGNKSVARKRGTTSAMALSRASSGDSSDHFGEEIAMTTNPKAYNNQSSLCN